MFQLGGPTHKHALPDDPTLKQRNNPYDKAAHARICCEFRIGVSSDFHYTSGSVVLHNWAGGPHDKRHLDDTADSQFDWFCPNTSEKLTQVGMARVIQSIEAFVYSVLGAQVNLRSSILGGGGGLKRCKTSSSNCWMNL